MLLTLLRNKTKSLHKQLDETSIVKNLMAINSGRFAYQNYLLATQNSYFLMQSACADSTLLQPIVNARLAFLGADISASKMTHSSLSGDNRVAFEDANSFELGAMYTLYGASHGAAILLSCVEKYNGHCQYLSCVAASPWKPFITYLNSQDCLHHEQEQLIAGSIQIFQYFLEVFGAPS